MDFGLYQKQNKTKPEKPNKKKQMKFKSFVKMSSLAAPWFCPGCLGYLVIQRGFIKACPYVHISFLLPVSHNPATALWPQTAKSLHLLFLKYLVVCGLKVLRYTVYNFLFSDFPHRSLVLSFLPLVFGAR